MPIRMTVIPSRAFDADRTARTSVGALTRLMTITKRREKGCQDLQQRVPSSPAPTAASAMPPPGGSPRASDESSYLNSTEIIVDGGVGAIWTVHPGASRLF